MRNKKDKMTFDRLVSSIQQVHDYLSAQAGKAVNISLTMRNWIIGLYIAEFEMHGADRAGYGDKLLASLAAELEKLNVSACGKRQLYQYLRFYQIYPQIVRSLTAQLHDLVPDAITDIERKVLKSKEVMSESELEDQLLDKLQEFLLELGHGFCFEARQKRILIGDTHNFVDMVFYHRILKCHVLVELKLDEFSHENIGQLNTYVSWYKKNIMTEGDNPPVGILLCTKKDHALVEYAIAGMDNGLFVSKYQLELPKKEEMQRFIEEKIREAGE